MEVPDDSLPSVGFQDKSLRLVTVYHDPLPLPLIGCPHQDGAATVELWMRRIASIRFWLHL